MANPTSTMDPVVDGESNKERSDSIDPHRSGQDDSEEYIDCGRPSKRTRTSTAITNAKDEAETPSVFEILIRIVAAMKTPIVIGVMRSMGCFP